MPDRLFITSWDIEHWGRASGNRQEEIPDGLTVVYGPNASGKSSAAMALAWMLAGPGFYAHLNPFGTTGDPLHASLTAQLGDDKVHLGVRMEVPQSTDRKLLKREGFTGDLGGVAIDRDSFRRRLGGVSFDLYRRYYWVDSLKISARRKTGDATACRRSSPALAVPWTVSNRPPRPARPSPRPAGGGRSTCSGSRRGSAAPLTWALRRWRRSAAGRRRRGRGGAPGLRAALGRPREAERPRLGRSCAPRAPATAPRRRPQSCCRNEPPGPPALQPKELDSRA